MIIAVSRKVPLMQRTHFATRIIIIAVPVLGLVVLTLTLYVRGPRFIIARVTNNIGTRHRRMVIRKRARGGRIFLLFRDPRQIRAMRFLPRCFGLFLLGSAISDWVRAGGGVGFFFTFGFLFLFLGLDPIQGLARAFLNLTGFRFQ